MPTGLMTVDDVAERLGLHPRTVRSYIRGGRLRATRIGKQYRITPADFATLTAPHAVSSADEDRVTGPAGPDDRQVALVVDSTAVVQVDGLDEAAAQRLLTLLSAMAFDAGVRTDLALQPAVGRLKVVVSGGLAATIEFLSVVEEAVEALRAEI